MWTLKQSRIPKAYAIPSNCVISVSLFVLVPAKWAHTLRFFHVKPGGGRQRWSLVFVFGGMVVDILLHVNDRHLASKRHRKLSTRGATGQGNHSPAVIKCPGMRSKLEPPGSYITFSFENIYVMHTCCD